MRLKPRAIMKILGLVMAISGLSMFPCIPIAIIYGEWEMMRHFITTVLVFFLGGGCLYLFTRNEKRSLNRREGFLVVALTWFVVCFIGSLPYVFGGISHTFIDAFFESASGFTTSGVTLISELSDLPRSLVFWRGITHWYGGMGILILAVSILPSLGIGASSLANAESSNQSIDRINSTIKDNVKNIYLIYVLFTIIETILLTLGNMNLFDAFYFTCGSMGNCVLQYNIGFSDHYSPYNEIVITVFCVLASVNFIAYQLLWKKRVKEFFKNPEIKTYFIMLLTAVVIVTSLLLVNSTYSNPIDAIRYGVIQTLMFASTGGYGATDYNVWPEATKWVLILCMFVGGCSSSTAGGLKSIRLAIVLQILRRNIFRRIHPRAIVAVKLGNEPISANRAQNTLAFFLLYTLTFFVGSMILSLDGQSFDTTATAVLASLSNTGLAFNNASFTGDWSVFSQAGRLFLSLIMIVGRLEIFTILMLFTSTFWRPNR